MKVALFLAKCIKEQNPAVKIVFGGYHPTVEPIKTMSQPQVDHVICGEGELGLHLLVKRTIAKKPCQQITHSQVIQELDELPFPNRELINQERTLQLTKEIDGERIASVQSSRGCPYRCLFCSNYRVHGPKIRRRSVFNVLKEITHLKEHWKINFLKFCDASINTSIEWLRQFSKGMRNQFRGELPWGANIHPARMDTRTLLYMKWGGCREIWVGVESGSQSVLDAIRKRVKIKQIKQVFRWAKKVKIKRRAYFMVGLPNETEEDVQQTFKLARELDADMYGMTILAPYPGCSIYGEFKDEMELEDVDWSLVDEYTNLIWHTEHFTNQELRDIQIKFHKLFKKKLAPGPTMRFGGKDE